MENITWKPIPHFEGYFVSDTGLVRSPRKLLAPYLTTTGYQMVCITTNCRRKQVFVHRLVLEVFIGPPPPKMECRHLDGNKLNNHLNNLRWGTRQENYQDNVRHNKDGLLKGFNPSFHTHRPQKLTADIVRQIRSEYVPYKVSKPMLAKKYGVQVSMIQLILERKSWKHID